MNLPHTEYIIEIYNDRTGDWEPKSFDRPFISLELAVEVLKDLRKRFCNSTYRLIKLTPEVVEV